MADTLLDFWNSYLPESSTPKVESATQTTDVDDPGPPPTHPPSPPPPLARGDVWMHVSDALHAWTQRLLDTEAQLSRANDFQQLISESLQRQKMDGLLSDLEVNEMCYIGQLWVDFSHLVSCYTIGCTVLKGKIISILLELYSMKQINQRMFIDVCMTL